MNAQYLKEERHGQILRLVQEEGRISVPDLSTRLGVSEATIRRDLDDLDGRGVRRAHGAALRPDPAAKEPPAQIRMQEQAAEKERIGRCAAGMIQDGETIVLGSGTTVLEIARHLPVSIQRLTVITNSVLVINELSGRPGIDLIVIGGMLRTCELSMVGHIAEQSIRELRADRAFLGMRAVDLRQGFTHDDPAETMTDRAFLAIAPETMVVADYSKFARTCAVFVAPLSAARKIITDPQVPEAILSEIRSSGVEVILA